jgi:hypothetical protein
MRSAVLQKGDGSVCRPADLIARWRNGQGEHAPPVVSIN